MRWLVAVLVAIVGMASAKIAGDATFLWERSGQPCITCKSIEARYNGFLDFARNPKIDWEK